MCAGARERQGAGGPGKPPVNAGLTTDFFKMELDEIFSKNESCSVK
jgi:hypothetical protein